MLIAHSVLALLLGVGGGKRPSIPCLQVAKPLELQGLMAGARFFYSPLGAFRCSDLASVKCDFCCEFLGF